MSLLRSRSWFQPRALAVALLVLALVGGAAAQAVKLKRELPYVPPKRWALMIGAERYEHYAPLQYAADDARAMAKTLVESYRFDPANVSVLADDGEAPAPTVANIRQRLDATLANPQLDKGDLFVFYFSGHGAGGSSGDYLLPTDTKRETFEQQGLPMREVLDRIVKAGLKNVLIIADACRSGQENPFGEELQELGMRANIAVVLGCAPGTRSYEYPNFQRGIFTHFLMRALSQQEPKEAGTGALWASAVAKRVQKEVAERTERDYGINAQRPALWSEPTQDVLIGAFVPESLAAENLKTFEEQAAKLNQQNYAKALATYAEALYEQDRYAEAIQLFKTLDGIGEMTPAERYSYAMSLRFADRYTEAVRAFDELEKAGHAVYSKLAVASNPTRSMPVEKRIASALALWRQTKNADFALLGLAVIQRLGEDQQLADYLDEVLAAKVFDEHRAAYAEGARGVALAQTKEAIAAYRRCVETGGPLAEAARLWLWVLYRQTADFEAMAQLAEKTTSDKATWHYLAATLALERGDRERFFAKAKDALLEGPNPEILQAIIREGGMETFQLADEIIAAADRHPYSWRAIMVKAFAESVKASPEERQAKVSARLQEAMKYADDPLGAFATMVSLLDILLEELHTKKAIPDEQYIMLLTAYAGFLADEAGEMGQDADLWFTTVYMGLRTQRATQLRAKIVAHLGPMIERGDLDPAVRGPLLLSAIAVGDGPLIDKLMKGRFDAFDAADAPWFLAVHHLGVGDDEALKKVIDGASDPSRELKPLAEAIRGYLDALAGRKAEALARAEKVPTDDPGLAAIKVLILKRLGEDPTDPFRASATLETWRYLPVSLRVLREHLRSTALTDEERVRLMLPATAHAGNPLAMELSFVGKPDVKAFAGSYQKRAVSWDDEMAQALWDFKMTVGETGDAKGTLGEIAFSGRVDEFGNLTATADYQGREWTIASKLCPPALSAKVPETSTFGFAFYLLDPKGARIAAYLVDLPKQ